MLMAPIGKTPVFLETGSSFFMKILQLIWSILTIAGIRTTTVFQMWKPWYRVNNSHKQRGISHRVDTDLALFPESCSHHVREEEEHPVDMSIGDRE